MNAYPTPMLRRKVIPTNARPLAGLCRGANSNYAEWIRTYSSQEFIAGAAKLGCLLDDLTAGWPAGELAPLETLFLTSSRYEYLFWEMAWTRSSWPV